MLEDKEDSEKDSAVSEEKTLVEKEFMIVVFLSVLLGVLLTVIAVGGLLYYQKSKALHQEMLVAKNELKEKNLALDEMKAQIEALSRQLYALREYSIARSGSASARNAKAAVAVPPLEISKDILALPEGKSPEGIPTPAVAPPPEVPKAPKVVIPPKQTRPQGQSCDLVGKSGEEQAAILKRCVGVMDMPPPQSPPKEKKPAR